MTWRERIIAARERGSFNAEDARLARSWRTCAVGEQRQQMPSVITARPAKQRDLGHEPDCPCNGCNLPSDVTIALLGSGDHGFYFAIQRNDFALAESKLDAIEDRALQLKREAGAPFELTP